MNMNTALAFVGKHWGISQPIRNSFAIKKLRDEYNVNFKKYSKKLLKDLKKRADEVNADIANKDPEAKKLFDNIIKFREMFVFWSDYSEKSFLESRL